MHIFVFILVSRKSNMQCNWQPLCSHAEVAVAVAAAIKYRNVSLSSQAELSFHYERNQLTQSQIIIWT